MSSHLEDSTEDKPGGPSGWDKIPVDQDTDPARSPFAPAENSSPQPTQHPIPCMQGAFDESIMESRRFSPQRLREKLDAEVRRRQMLELETYSEEYSSRWKQKPGAKFHPLVKLIAQISFGINLIHNKKAKSEEEVIRILQSHVDEVDAFVEDTTADFDLAIKDLEERINHLEVPLGHGRAFNKMLCDKAFREAIIDGNDIIERVIQRTTQAMDAALRDVEEGIGAITELSKFLDRIGRAQLLPNTLNIYATMQGNVEGWAHCFVILQGKSERLTTLMSELSTLMDECAKRAGIASRRYTPMGIKNIRKSQLPPAAPKPPRKPKPRIDKPLPLDPMHKALAYAGPDSRKQLSVRFDDQPERPKTSDALRSTSQISPSSQRPHSHRSASDLTQLSPRISITPAPIGLGIATTSLSEPTTPPRSETSQVTSPVEKSIEKDSPQSNDNAPAIQPKDPPRTSQPPRRANYSTFPKTPQSPSRLSRPSLDSYDLFKPPSPTKSASVPYSPDSLSLPIPPPLTSAALAQIHPAQRPLYSGTSPSVALSLSPLTSNPVSPQRSCFNEIIKKTLEPHVEEVEGDDDDDKNDHMHQQSQQTDVVVNSPTERWPSVSDKSANESPKKTTSSPQDSAYSSGLTTSRVSEELPSLGLATSAGWSSPNSGRNSALATASMTALPSLEPVSPDGMEYDWGNRKPSFGRKASIASFRALFVKKTPPPRREERIISSGGLGGCVVLTEV